MEQLKPFKIAFSGTPDQITDFLDGKKAINFAIIDTVGELLKKLPSVTNDRCQLYSNEHNNNNIVILPLVGKYSYGIDVYDFDTDRIDIGCTDSHGAVFHVVDRLDMIGETIPTPEKVTIQNVDVSEASTDELIYITDRYDVIHAEAKVELLKRLENIKDKAGITF